MKLNLKKGDEILTGKWQNKTEVVKKVGKNELGQPTVNDKPMLKFRIKRLMPKKKVEESYIKTFESFLNEECDIKLNKYVYHASAIINRERIDKNGILPFRGEQWLSDTDIEGDAVFATNSDNPKDWFDSTWDDDVWQIDTTKIPNVKWERDPNTESELCTYIGKWIYTKQPIPREAIKLLKKGTGKDR